MIREDTYLVIKKQDLIKYLGETEREILFTLVEKVKLARRYDGKETHKYLILSDAWPEYSMALNALEKRIDG
jgi:hypothetical protein